MRKVRKERDGYSVQGAGCDRFSVFFFFQVKNHVWLGLDFVHFRDISMLHPVKRWEVLSFFFFGTNVSIDV